jgi:hypothetical protein
MTPDDVESFIKKLEGYGLVFNDSDKAIDIAVIDQIRGPTINCEWLEFGHINLDMDEKKIAACRLVNSKSEEIYYPDGWVYEESLVVLMDLYQPNIWKRA